MPKRTIIISCFQWMEDVDGVRLMRTAMPSDGVVDIPDGEALERGDALGYLAPVVEAKPEPKAAPAPRKRKA